MRWLITLGVGTITLLALAVVLLPTLISTDRARAYLQERLVAALERPVDIGGPVELSLLPLPALRATEIEIGRGSATDPLIAARVDALRAELALWPLLEGRLQITEAIFDQPHLALELGREIAPPAAEPATEDRPTADAPASDSEPARARLRALSLDKIVISGGSLLLVTGEGKRLSVTDLTADLSVPGLDAAATFDVSATWQGQTIGATGTLSSLRSLIDGEATAFALALLGPKLTAEASGTAELGEGPEVSAEIFFESADIGEPLLWLTGNAPTVPAWREVVATTKLQASSSSVLLAGLRLTLDGETADGELELALAGGRPALSGKLAFQTLDLKSKRRPVVRPNPSEVASEPRDAGSDTAPSPTPPQPTATAGPDEPTPSSAKPAGILPLDLDLALTWQRLLTAGLDTGAGDLRITADASRIDTAIAKLTVFDGTLAGSVAITGDLSNPTVQPDLHLNGADALPVLVAMGMGDMLKGSFNTTFAGGFRGIEGNQPARTLSGKGTMQLSAGTLQVPSALRSHPAMGVLVEVILQGQTNLVGVSGGGSFIAKDGVLDNEDLELAIPAGRLLGRGQVDLGRRVVNDYVIQFVPIVPGTPIPPVRLRGPFDRLQAIVDPTALLEQPAAAAQEALEQLRQGDAEGAAETFINKGVGGLLRSFGIRP